MAFTGYHLYRGEGAVERIDFSAPVAVSIEPAATLAQLGHAPDSVYAYAVRPVLDGLETPDISCTVVFATGPDGGLLGPPPPRILRLDARPAAALQAKLLWSWRDRPDAPAVGEFCIYAASDRRGSARQQLAAIPHDRDGVYRTCVELPGPGSWFLSVAPVSVGSAAAAPSPPAGPIVVPAPLPAEPASLLSAVRA